VAVTEWNPATEAEAAMRDALRLSDQEQYFRILGKTDLFLPVSADALAGRAPMGWGTWSSGGRTHVLAFTSPEAMKTCLAEHAGSARKIDYPELADTWPNHEWWLAVNPGLPIEGYLPPWFVTQLARGDVRLPGRTTTRNRPAGTAAAAAAAGSARATAEKAARGGTATSVIEDVEVVEPKSPARARRAAASRTPNGRPDRRPRRRDSAIIDAEIIESTVLGPTALEATVVSATLVDEAVIDSEAIDATVVETPAETPQAARTERRAPGRPTAAPAEPVKPAPFAPANEVEENLLDAAVSGKTNNFLSTLLLAKVLIPIPVGESADVKPDNPAFPWRREVVDGQQYLVVFTSAPRMNEFMGADVPIVTAKFLQLIRNWPDVDWSFAVNPGSPVGATLPGAQIKALALWAEDVGLTDDEFEPDVVEAPPPAAPTTIVMQKPIAASQVTYYLERGYDRVSGFVHRAVEVAHLRTPDQVYAGLGLSYSGSPFARDAEEIFVLRWAAHRGDLYRIPYGGQHDAAMRAMQGWMIERAPFRGNGFAPAERGEVIAEFKVDSIRLPHGAQMWRLNKAGEAALIAVLDADECQWRSARDAGVIGDWDPTVAPRRNQPAITQYAAPAARTPEAAAATDDPLDPRWRPAQVGGG
jgi:hypothetical protein